MNELARAVVTYEAAHQGPHTHRKSVDIRDTFGFSPTRYYQLLLRSRDDMEALAIFPTLPRYLDARLTALDEHRPA